MIYCIAIWFLSLNKLVNQSHVVCLMRERYANLSSVVYALGQQLLGTRRERELKNGMKHYWISTGQSGKLNSAMFCISITDEISASQKSSRKSVMFCKYDFNASSCSQAWQKVCAKF